MRMSKKNLEHEEPKSKSRDLFFGSLLILDNIKKIGDTLGWLSVKPQAIGGTWPPLSVIPQDSDSSFHSSLFRFHIKYMTEEEVMNFLISTKQ